MTTTPPQTRSKRPGSRPSQSWLAVVMVVVLAVACDGSSADEAPVTVSDAADDTATVPNSEPDGDTMEASATTTVAAAEVPAEDAIRRAEDYLAAFATGDVDAVLNSLTDDFVMRRAFPRDALGETQLLDWLGVVHQAALGTVYAEPDCAAGDAGPTATVVECGVTMVTPMHAQTNAPGVPSTLTITLTAEGVASVDQEMLTNLDLLGYYTWRELQDPPPIDDPTSVEEAIEVGELDARFAMEYAAFGVTTAEEVFGAFNSADLDGFLAGFMRGAEVLGVRASEAHDVFSALIAGGQRYELAGCAPAGVVDRTLAIECSVTVLPALGSSGIEMTGTMTMNISADGTIRTSNDDIDGAPALRFRTDFEHWLADTHPDVHGQVTFLPETMLPSADDHELAASHYEEFIDQSDAYPLTS